MVPEIPLGARVKKEEKNADKFLFKGDSFDSEAILLTPIYKKSLKQNEFVCEGGGGGAYMCTVFNEF